MKESDEDKEGMKEEEEEEARRKEIETLLARVTHLHLESRGITHIVSFVFLCAFFGGGLICSLTI